MFQKKRHFIEGSNFCKKWRTCYRTTLQYYYYIRVQFSDVMKHGFGGFPFLYLRPAISNVQSSAAWVSTLALRHICCRLVCQSRRRALKVGSLHQLELQRKFIQMSCLAIVLAAAFLKRSKRFGVSPARFAIRCSKYLATPSDSSTGVKNHQLSLFHSFYRSLIKLFISDADCKTILNCDVFQTWSLLLAVSFYPTVICSLPFKFPLTYQTQGTSEGWK